MSAASLLLTPDELVQLSGGYTQPARQLEELKRQGFWRARRAPTTGALILERSHYDAVCAGADLQAGTGRRRAGPEPELCPA
jgi:hypothetical protein